MRNNLSTDLAAAVREMILVGDLAAGTRINEVHLAAALSVSRTPLREALSRLATEGAITSIPRLGFYVCALSVEEVEDLYPIRAILDPAALRLGGLPPASRIKRLKVLNRRFAAAIDAIEAVRLDNQWHLELLAGCPNAILFGFIEQMVWRTRRYELGLMGARANVERATCAHDRIIEALEAGDLEGACAALEVNMSDGKQPVLDWLEERAMRG